MNLTRRRLLTGIILGIAMCLNAVAREGDTIIHLRTAEGLSHASVTCILSDPYGFTWFGTPNGLNRYDGLETRLFLHDSRDTNTISHNEITALLDDGEGLIWIGTENGLNTYDAGRGRFIRYLYARRNPGSVSGNVILSLLRSSDGSVWAGTHERGLNRFNRATGKFDHFINHVSLSSNSIYCLAEDRFQTGILWLGTGDGLFRFDTSTGRFSLAPGTQSGRYQVRTMAQDSSGNLWLGTWGRGILKYNLSNRTLEKYTMAPATGKNISNSYIRSIIATDNGTMLAAIKDNGLMRFDGIGQQLLPVQMDKYPGAPESFDIQSLYLPDSGLLWIGTSTGVSLKSISGLGGSASEPAVTAESRLIITEMGFYGHGQKLDVTQLSGYTSLVLNEISVRHKLNNFFVQFVAIDFSGKAGIRYRYKLEGYDQTWMDTDASRRYINYTNLPPGDYVFRVEASGAESNWGYAEREIRIAVTPPFYKTWYFRLGILLVIIGGLLLLIRAGLLYLERTKKTVEQAAQASLFGERNQLRTLIDSMPDLIYIKDRASRFITANKRTAFLLGTTPLEMVGKTDFDFIERDLAQRFFDDEVRIMETGTPLLNFEEPGLDEQGNRIIMSTTKVPLYGPQGDIIGLVGIGRDITRMKRIEIQLRKKSEDLQEINRLLEERQEEVVLQSEELASYAQNLKLANHELEHLNKTKDKFFSIIAHDLRNPFNAIIGFSEMMQRDYNELDSNHKISLLEMIRISSETAYNLLENLLQWSQTQTGKIVFAPEQIDLAPLVESSLSLLSVNAEKKGVFLRNDVMPGTMVTADRNMVNTIIRNLISNAIKFSLKGGEVLVSARPVNEMIEISVRDRGIGMPRDVLHKLFRIDTYHSSNGTAGESGTGLGLVICKEFIEKHKGRIKAESAEGKGTTISFTLSQSGQDN